MTQPQATRSNRAPSSSRRAPKAPVLRQAGPGQDKTGQGKASQSRASQSQTSRGGVIEGATALKPLSAPLSAETGTDATRTPLSLVRSRPGRRRTPFVVFCFLTLVAAMATVLVLNISVSSGQYELVQLNNKKDALVKSNQVLAQQLQNDQAPQNLVNRAQQLGMVAASTTGQINVDTKTIAGSPKPAEKQSKPMPVIAAPEIGGTEPVSVTDPAGTSSTGTDKPQAGQSTAGQAGTGQSAAGQQGSSPAKPVKPATPVKPVTTPKPDLHGGTIPSPQQKSPSKH